MDRIGAVQRFVEHEHVRIAHECRGDLRALAHALAELVDAAVGDVEHLDGLQRVLRRAPIGDAVEVGDVADELARGEPARHRFVLRYQREPAEHLAIAAGVAAFDRTLPWLTSMRPVIARISVVLPAPLGPSRPVTPGPNEQLSSDSATFWRNHTDTLSTVTVASSTNAGSFAVFGTAAGSDVIAPPSGTGAAARHPRRARADVDARIANSPPLLTPVSGECRATM